MIPNKSKIALPCCALLSAFLCLGSPTLTLAENDIPSASLASLYQTALRSFNSRDFETAFSQLLPLAHQEHAESQYRLGYMYLNGLGVMQDPLEASRWFERAANQGHAAAQNDLGTLFFNGQGVERNLNTALELYQLAAVQGHEVAQRNVERVHQALGNISTTVAAAPAALTQAAQLPPTTVPTAPVPVAAAIAPAADTVLPIAQAPVVPSPIATRPPFFFRALGVDFGAKSLTIWPFTFSTQPIRFGVGFDGGQ